MDLSDPQMGELLAGYRQETTHMSEILEALYQKIDEVSSLIYNMDNVEPNPVNNHYRTRATKHLCEARMSLREAADEMEWFLRKV